MLSEVAEGEGFQCELWAVGEVHLGIVSLFGTPLIGLKLASWLARPNNSCSNGCLLLVSSQPSKQASELQLANKVEREPTRRVVDLGPDLLES